jgi:hypothetical protein
MERTPTAEEKSVAHIWKELELPAEALVSLRLTGDTKLFPSSFKIAHLAQVSIALSALAAALFWSVRHQAPVPKVLVPAEHTCVEFKSERLYSFSGKLAPSSFGTIGGLHKTADGYVRMHDSFPNHREQALKLLGLRLDASRDDVAAKMLDWQSVELEAEAFCKGAVIAALRSFEEWDKLPQAEAVSDHPISMRALLNSEPYILPVPTSINDDKSLRGIRIVEMSRVIAAPVAGKTLAAHGADVLWVTSSTLPDLPDLDIDLSRGKRTVQLNVKNAQDKARLLELLRTADVFIQSYRPGSLAAQGLSIEELIKTNPHLIIGTLSAYGQHGPWAHQRGFDSLVQTCSGINVEDAKRYGADEPARVLPCQALDHGAGYFLATGIMAALYKRAVVGGSFEVHVSLAGVMKYLRSLGQFEGKTGFDRENFTKPEEAEKYQETRQTGFGELRAIRHSATIEGVDVGWEEMPKPLGTDQPAWL